MTGSELHVSKSACAAVQVVDCMESEGTVEIVINNSIY
jgi:hypothetical protein